MTASKATQCKECKRVVWSTDVNASGKCIVCAPPIVEPVEPVSKA